MKLLRQVTLDRASRKKDRSVSLTFITATEQSTTEFAEIDEILNTHGLLYFKPDGTLNEDELKALDNIDIEVQGKTKSQRLRGALMVLHSKTNDLRTKEEFYTYYMEKFIKHIVEQIPE